MLSGEIALKNDHYYYYYYTLHFYQLLFFISCFDCLPLFYRLQQFFPPITVFPLPHCSSRCFPLAVFSVTLFPCCLRLFAPACQPLDYHPLLSVAVSYVYGCLCQMPATRLSPLVVYGGVVCLQLFVPDASHSTISPCCLWPCRMSTVVCARCQPLDYHPLLSMAVSYVYSCLCQMPATRLSPLVVYGGVVCLQLFVPDASHSTISPCCLWPCRMSKVVCVRYQPLDYLPLLSMAVSHVYGCLCQMPATRLSPIVVYGRVVCLRLFVPDASHSTISPCCIWPCRMSTVVCARCQPLDYLPLLSMAVSYVYGCLCQMPATRLSPIVVYGRVVCLRLFVPDTSHSTISPCCIWPCRMSTTSTFASTPPSLFIVTHHSLGEWISVALSCSRRAPWLRSV